MIIEVTERAGHLEALGHRVPLAHGGEPELRRRCLETLSRYKEPPSQIWFQRAGTDAAAPSPLQRDDAPAVTPSTPAPPPEPPEPQRSKRRK